MIISYIKNLFLGTRYRGNLQLDELDGIRGLAVLFVLFSHLANEGLICFPIHLSGNGSGKIGVYLFFTLSSFLLSRALLSRACELNAFDWLKYSVRRLMRIYPFYIAALGFVVCSSLYDWQLFDPMGMGDFYRHVLILDGKGHFWTIATEVKFYLILPVFIFIYRHMGESNKGYFIFGLLILSLVSQLVSLSGVIEIRHSLVRYLPVFTLGTVAAVLHEGISDFKGVKISKSARNVSLVLALVIFCLMPNVLGELTENLIGRRFQILIPSSFFWGAICSSFVLSCVLAKHSFVSILFCSSWIRFVGAISFSLYINHWFVLMWVKEMHLGAFAKISVFWTLSLSLSAITFLVLERPLSRVRLEVLVANCAKRLRA